MGDEYLEVLKVKLNEFKALSNYLRNPAVSTQHGVKERVIILYSLLQKILLGRQ